MKDVMRSENQNMLTIVKLSPHTVDAWDNYVTTHPKACFFHLSGWKEVLETAFKHEAPFLMATRDGSVVGVLPLAHISSMLFGSSLCSTPFCVTGGVIASDEEASDALIKTASEMAEKLKVKSLEIRNLDQSDYGWPTKELYVNFAKTLDPINDNNLKNIPRKQRAMVRKGIKAGLESIESENIDEFYAIYSESVRNLGTPVFSKKLFRTLQSVFGDKCRILTVVKDREPIASVMSFYFRDTVLPYYGGSKSVARSLAGNDFMYWELMRRSVEEGIKHYDFGRSKIGTGSYNFKKNWGFEPKPLYYENLLIKSTEVPNINPTNPKYQSVIKAWKKLPLPVANLIGPHLSRALG